MDGGKEIMNKSLFVIQTDLKSLIEDIEEAGGEVTPEQIEQLTISRTELQTKSLNYVHYIKKLESDIELAKVYEEQVEQFKKRKQKLIDRLKETLLTAVENFGDIETEIFKVTTRKSESVEVVDIDKIPSEYLVPKTTYSLDKVKVKYYLKEGKEVPGAILKVNQNLAIK
jgi:hypothetical protein